MPSVLVVDDEPDSREAVARYLRKGGCVVRCARNGRDALVALGTCMPDVVILDWMMPEMNGITFLQVIRSYLRWSTLPVILLTAHHGAHVDEARELGVQSVFFKGHFELADLLACVRRHARSTDDGTAAG